MKRLRPFHFLVVIGLVLFLSGGFVVVPVFRQVRQVQMDRELINRVAANDTQGAIALLQRGANPNAHQQRGARPSFWQMAIAQFRHHRFLASAGPSALVLASRGETVDDDEANPAPDENIAMVSALLRAGADPNDRSQNGETPLLNAVKGKNREVVQLLLSRGADPNLAASDGAMPLIEATETNADIVTLLLIHGANPNVGGFDDRPLTDAAWGGDVEMVRSLLKHGADPHYRDAQAGTADGNDYSAMFAAQHEFWHTPPLHAEYAQIVELLKNSLAKK